MSTYTDNRLDFAVARATPVFSASHTGELPMLANQQHGYLVAGNGLFVVGRGAGFTAVIALAESPTPTPFARVTPGIYFDAGRIPRTLINHAADRAIECAPIEYAGAITYRDDGYALAEPRIDSASPSHVTYDRTSVDDDALAVDLHSHGLTSPYFSSTDNASDEQGIYIAVVFGHCADRRRLSHVARVTINGHTLALEPDDWLNG